MTDARAFIVLQAAVSLISAGGRYQHVTVTQAVEDYFDDAEPCDCEACRAPTKNEVN